MKTNVDIKFNVDVKRKYKFQGKEYGSFEELPPEGQALFRKAGPADADLVKKLDLNLSQTKINYKGKEYNLEELPPHVQEMYHKLMAMKDKDKKGAIEPSSGSEIGDIPEPTADVQSGGLPTEPIAPKAFSSWLRIVLILIAIGMIYMIVSRLHY